MDLLDLLNNKDYIKEELSGGLINKVYKITTNDNIYVVKVLNKYYENQIDRINNTEVLSNICNDYGITVGNAIKINDKYVNKVNDEYVIVYKFIDGISIEPKDINKDHVIKIADLISQIHNIDYTEGYNRIVRHSIDWEKFIHTEDFNNMSYKDLYLNNYKEFYNIFEVVIGYKNNIIPTLGICHRDIKPSNIIWSKDEPYLIDFESTRIDDKKYDFIETMLRWCGLLTLNLNYDYIDAFVSEYKKHRDISAYDYRGLLYANLLGRFDFLYYNLDITLVNKIEDINKYNEAQNQVIVMINEINYYLKEIDNLINYFEK